VELAPALESDQHRRNAQPEVILKMKDESLKEGEVPANEGGTHTGFRKVPSRPFRYGTTSRQSHGAAEEMADCTAREINSNSHDY